eukprot:CAMPEP_0195507478 /NCGR_PEP_ID=MMETSP0794_2-20130614/917_1 /TAXON_ID=515487 /ORGANISM="Stephanopyxis turris, Strain CCMP 815" /LENGTH=150 /DNA_ID=CAMNT_0040634171 /DNA_START=70 /DNA_END=522 /DNA_ORIENTATION=+
MATERRIFTTSSLEIAKAKYPHFERRQTRFNDNDMFGHINNSVYYSIMDDAINAHLMNRGIGLEYPRFVVENGIKYTKPISYPTEIEVGLRVVKLGTSSVTYDVGIFGADPGALAALGKFVHVYVCGDGRPRPIDEAVRNVLAELQLGNA